MTELRTDSPQAKPVSALPNQQRTGWNLVLWNLDHAGARNHDAARDAAMDEFDPDIVVPRPLIAYALKAKAWAASLATPSFWSATAAWTAPRQAAQPSSHKHGFFIRRPSPARLERAFRGRKLPR
jgi:hypothetical protein